MSFTYVIPDIHGRCDLLRGALARIDLHSGGEPGVIVTIGDYIDKGPESKQVIDLMMEGVAANWKLVTLKGNHEVLMEQALRDPLRVASWVEKGGDTALQSYGDGIASVPQAHIDWLARLQLMHVDAHRIYVHAGVDPDVSLDRQSKTTLLCKRYPKGYAAGFGKLHVVHGHDSDANGPLLHEGRTNLDTLAWRTGRLTVGIFDHDRAGGPVDFIVVEGPPAGRAS